MTRPLCMLLSIACRRSAFAVHRPLATPGRRRLSAESGSDERDNLLFQGVFAMNVRKVEEALRAGADVNQTLFGATPLVALPVILAAGYAAYRDVYG